MKTKKLIALVLSLVMVVGLLPVGVVADGETVDKAALKQLIDTVSADGYAENFYQSGDKWNGKNASTNGFWSDMQTALTTARNAYQTDNYTSINNAYAALADAVANLIPITQANTTDLHNAVEGRKNLNNNNNFYTDASWNNFTAARTAAGTLMDSMFNTDGNATVNNVYSVQPDVDKAAKALEQAYKDLLSNNQIGKIATVKTVQNWLLGKNLVENKYSTASWQSWTDKRTDLEKVKDKPITLDSDYHALIEAVSNANTAYYGLTSENNINVHVRVADNFGALYPQYALSSEATAAYDADVVLTDDHTIGGLLTAMNFNRTAKKSLNYGSTEAGKSDCVMVYLNGTLAVDRSNTPDDWNAMVYNGLSNVLVTNVANMRLNDGDDVVIVRAQAPYYNYYIDTVPNAPYLSYCEQAALLDIQSDNNEIEAKAGTAFSLSVLKKYGAVESPNYGETAKPANGVSLFVSEKKDNEAAARGAEAITAIGAVTDASGSASLTIYAEGWYKLFVADVRSAVAGAAAQGTDTSAGSFPNLAGGDYVLVHVVKSSDDSAARAVLQAELDKVYHAYEQGFYTEEQWTTVNTAYQTASATINDSDLLGDAYNAQKAAIAIITELQEKNSAQNEVAIRRMSSLLMLLPTKEQIGAGLFTQKDATRMNEAIAFYPTMTEYQRAQLTKAQSDQWTALQEAWGEDGSKLPEKQQITFTIAVEGNYGSMFNKTKQLAVIVYTYKAKDDQFAKDSTHSPKAQKLDSLPTTITLDAPCEGWVLSLAPDGKPADFEVYKVTWEGVNEEDVEYELNTAGNAYKITVKYSDAGTNEITKPAVRGDVKVTIWTRSTSDLAAKKDAALAALETTYQGYNKSSYSAAKWVELTSAYNAGRSAIEAAENENGINSAKQDASSAMAAVKTIQQEKEKEEKGKLGSVHVIVENTTYNGAPAAMQGRFVELDMPLDTDTTMMTAVLSALEESGYGWVGTGGSPNGKDITYLATISRGADTLSEFDGSQAAGWMGVLNDWFVNEGFQSFSASASQRDYQIVDGDEIRVMFTLAGYGRDLGGSWGNPDTSLKELSYTGGILTPAFDSALTDYVLTLSGGGVSVLPTAANKNYQVKTFLNVKNTERNVDYYRRGESIPVQAGDVIWIGCGEKNWLSMNNQGTEAGSYSGTWYKITVVDNSSAASVIALIEQVGTITYSNYQSKQSAVKAARAAYDALKDNAKQSVDNYATLTAAEAKIKSYQEIDSVKTLLAKLPKSANMTDAQVTAAKAQIEAAYAAYEKLTEEQRDYITVGDAKNYNELVDRLKDLTPSTSAQTIVGSEKKKEDEGSEIAPAQVAVAPEVVNGEAKAEIAAEDVSKAIEEAPDAKTLTVTVSTEGADKVEADLPAEAVKAAANAGVGLNVETENGTVKLSAADVKAASGKDLAVSVKENADGSTTIGVTAGGKAVDTKVKIELPAEQGKLLVIVDADGKETVVKKSVEADGKVYAEIPAGATVKAVDAEGGAFGDVKQSDWFAGAVEFVTSHGLFQGTGEGFEPNAPMNRAMLATVLYRLEGGKVSGSNPFADVPADAWYTDAVTWASEQGIVTGTGDGFDPMGKVTREQIATMLYRYVKTLGLDVSGAADLSKFDDGGETADWASEAMRWAVSAGLFRGDANGSLNPKGDATRAEVATLLQRLVKLIVK